MYNVTEKTKKRENTCRTFYYHSSLDKLLLEESLDMNPTSSLSVLGPLKSARIWLFPPLAPRPNSECQPADEEVGVPSETEVNSLNQFSLQRLFIWKQKKRAIMSFL